jgi:hypothetical protein
MGAYDSRTIHRDSIQALVRDVPALGIALPILKFYHGLIEKANFRDLVEIGDDFEADRMEYDPHAPHQPCGSDVINLARAYGLDRLCERKLDPIFGKKNPFLYVRNS